MNLIVISPLVIVPVLSEHITVTSPNVSIMDILLTIAFFSAMRFTPKASVVAKTTGNPSGKAETDSAIINIKISIKTAVFRTGALNTISVPVAIEAIIATVTIYFAILFTLFCNGNSFSEKELPLQNKVNNIAKYMVTVAIIASIATGTLIVFRAPVLNTAVLIDILILMIALSVSAFPEGFPVVLATTLALGVKRMAEKNAIVNRMSIIETLGEVTVICSDKTGTITKGEMTIKFIFTGNNLYEVEGSGFVAHGKITKGGIEIDVNKQQDVKQLLLTSILCNNSEIERTGNDNEYRAIGSPTETALLILGAKTGAFKETYLYDRVDEHPFNSDRKMMSVLYKQGDRYFVYAKGAPEVILEKCTKLYNNGNEKDLTDKEKESLYSLQQ